ncbi:MAG: succinyldiaminopimelate transaminase [Candidatus Nanopelagicales bacterium]|nr:succinyldiaminopimelate transaminase [Candidatus Nanopelagicales bacterium]
MTGDRWAQLPDFPWDALVPFTEIARNYSDGMIDLSVGTPVDSTPLPVQQALAQASDAPGYPTTAGIAQLSTTFIDWARTTLGAPDTIGVLPSIGSKELIAALPNLLGLGIHDRLVIPEVAYPTYQVGGLAGGLEVVATDSPELLSAPVSMVWLNSPSNPTGEVLSLARLQDLVSWGQSHDVVIVSDECYFELGWEAEPVSILDRRVNGGNLTGLLAVHSLSKRSNMAGYRFGTLAGDPELVHRILGIRKHLGMMVPTFVQYAAVAAYQDIQHIREQKERYRARRAALKGALSAFGFEICHSQAGLYLWATQNKDCWESVAGLAKLGILVTPGVFYGEKGQKFVRVALTASDLAVAQAVSRLAAGV